MAGKADVSATEAILELGKADVSEVEVILESGIVSAAEGLDDRLFRLVAKEAELSEAGWGEAALGLLGH
jgi:hypothetical protein